MKTMLKIMIMLLSLSLISCGQLMGDKTGANDLPETGLQTIGGLEATDIEVDSYLLKGTASNGGYASHNFKVKFKLPKDDELTFFFYTSNKLQGGSKFIFSRVEDELILEMVANGKSHKKNLENFSLEDDIVNLSIDLHNDHTDVHLLIWNAEGPFGDQEECSFEGGCIYNSEDFAFDYWLGVGRLNGVYWGFKGDKSLILSLEGPLEALSDA